MDAVFTAPLATQIISTIMSLLGEDEADFATATRRDDSVTLVGLTDETDAVLRASEDKIWEASAKAGSPFIPEMIKGFPTLTNRVG